MNRLALLLAVALLGAAAVAGRHPHTAPPVRVAMPVPAFVAYDVYIDTAGEPLGAYQVAITSRTPGVALVGVEGGEHPAYSEPPYYDPAALGGGRIILGAFSTADELPRGRTRIARLHLRLENRSEATFNTRPQTVATASGARIAATVTMLRSDSTNGDAP